MTVADVAAALGLTPMRIYQLVHAKEIPAVRIGGRIRIPRGAFEAWLLQQDELALAAVAR